MDWLLVFLFVEMESLLRCCDHNHIITSIRDLSLPSHYLFISFNTKSKIYLYATSKLSILWCVYFSLIVRWTVFKSVDCLLHNKATSIDTFYNLAIRFVLSLKMIYSVAIQFSGWRSNMDFAHNILEPNRQIENFVILYHEEEIDTKLPSLQCPYK